MFDQILRKLCSESPLRLAPRRPWAEQPPTYLDASPRLIEAALERSQRTPTGNWYAIAASRTIRPGKPFGTDIAGIELVAWRDGNNQLCVGPRACPHLGADLATGVVDQGRLICRWHGLALEGTACEFGWKPLPSYDDGVLAWVRLDGVGGETPTDAPILPERPAGATLASVTAMIGACEPQDVIANRLDPWHGDWLHPYSFTNLEVLSTPTADEDFFLVSVMFRMGPFGAPAIAKFSCPDARTIVMHIVDGEGAGSVVETHATQLTSRPGHPPQTVILEASIAYSDRPWFQRSTRIASLITPVMGYAAGRLWRDDLVYAERRYLMRTKSVPTEM